MTKRWDAGDDDPAPLYTGPPVPYRLVVGPDGDGRSATITGTTGQVFALPATLIVLTEGESGLWWTGSSDRVDDDGQGV